MAAWVGRGEGGEKGVYRKERGKGEGDAEGGEKGIGREGWMGV